MGCGCSTCTTAGKKSLAYSLTYQSTERRLTDEEVLKIRQRIVRRTGSGFGGEAEERTSLRYIKWLAISVISKLLCIL